MIAPAIVAPAPALAAGKLATQAYLPALPLLLCTLLRARGAGRGIGSDAVAVTYRDRRAISST